MHRVHLARNLGNIKHRVSLAQLLRTDILIIIVRSWIKLGCAEDIKVLYHQSDTCIFLLRHTVWQTPEIIQNEGILSGLED